jgi:hypothetical protein
MKDPSKYQDGSVSMYATAEKVPDVGLLDQFLKIVWDCYLRNN